LIFDRELTDGTSKAIGIDLLLKKSWAPLNIWLNYSLSRAQYTFDDEFITSFDAPRDIRHIGNIVASYQIKRLQLSLTGRFHSGLPYTEPSGIRSTFDDIDQTTLFDLEYDQINNRRLRPYSRIDFGINDRTPFVKQGKLRTEVALSVINIFQRENVFVRGHFLDLEQNSIPPPIAFVDSTLLRRTPLLLFRLYW